MDQRVTFFAAALVVCVGACGDTGFVDDGTPGFGGAAGSGARPDDGGTLSLETCEVDDDCAPVCGDFGACGGFDNTCSEMGTQSRECIVKECVAGACVEADKVEEVAACARETEGITCAESEVSESECSELENTCDQVGIRIVTQVDYACSAGVCEPQTSETEEACTRSTDGDTCGETVIQCGACQYESTCDETGSKVCETTTFDCGNGNCGSTTVATTVSCSRNTDGNVCTIRFCGNPATGVGTRPICCSAGGCDMACGACIK